MKVEDYLSEDTFSESELIEFLNKLDLNYSSDKVKNIYKELISNYIDSLDNFCNFVNIQREEDNP